MGATPHPAGRAALRPAARRPDPDAPTGPGDPGGAPTLVEAERHARACTLCAPHLPLGPRPILQVGPRAPLLITSQAPGTKAHLSGIPFDDASGERLRDWLGLDRPAFYDLDKVAILPTGMCYPGRLPRGGDRPPRPECAPTWHPRILPLLAGVRLRLLVGSYAIRSVLGPGMTLAERVRRHAEHRHANHGPAHWPLPHPSWRTLVWASRNPWFEAEVIPALRAEVRRLLG